MNSRTSFSTTSELVLNSWLITFTMSGSDDPLSSNSRILRPHAVQVEHLTLLNI